MLYSVNPKKMLKEHDYGLTASSWLLLMSCSAADILPHYISSGASYTIGWTALEVVQSEVVGYIRKIPTIQSTIDAVVGVINSLMPESVGESIDQSPDNSYFNGKKDKPIASSYLFATTKNLLAASADYYYLHHASSAPIGILAVFSARFTFEFMQRVLDGYQYEGKSQKDNFAQIAQRGALRACAGTAVHLCIITMIHDQQHLVSKIAIIPYIYILKLAAESFANTILNTNKATAELCTNVAGVK